ncbi:hypothetical protein EMPS_06574 [Entomortierella parvispora]|uniref:F-box domain-containing protein n=1 Tax=Entomortierella parvispora TaxID=205924 RepID=A0A9P3LXC5_9FUNG|nr:hypothetical protein EMPS_06574 [Entomortierella parvispora]
MDLLEIRFEIVKYLEYKDLHSCLFVNRTWNDMFLPFVYSELCIQLNDWPSAEGVLTKVPSVDVLRRFGHHIRELEVRVVKKDPPDHPFIIKNIKGPSSALEKSATTTTTTTITNTATATTAASIPGNALFPNIRWLTLDLGPSYGPREIVDWVIHSPTVEEVVLRNPPRLLSDAPRTDYSPLRQCPRLSRLLIFGNSMNENDLAGIVSNCPHVTDITLWNQWIVEPVLTALEGCFDRISTLDMSEGTFGYKSWWNQRILCSCPHLVEFRCRTFKTGDCLVQFGIRDYSENKESQDLNTDSDAAIIKDSTINTTIQKTSSEREGHPQWICAPTLRILEIKRLKWSMDQNWENERMMDQLKQLKQLEVLTIGVIARKYRTFE